jgi:ribose transport system substrate-binding protein
MKKTNVVFLLFFCAIIILGTIGCTKKEDTASNDLIIENKESDISKNKETAVEQKKNIALVMKTLTNPFFIEMEKGARKAEQELGINLIVKTGAKETSIEQQIAIVEELITEKVDGIVIAPGSSTDLIPVLKKAKDAGIKIINIDNRLDKEISNKIGLLDVPYVGVDNEKGAYLAAKYMSSKITSPINVAIIEGISGVDNAEQRKAGALRAFSENSNIKLAASQSANWKIDEAYTVTKQILNKYSNIGAIFCANDMMALGCIQYLDENKKDKIIVGGFDALDEGKKAIKEGKLLVTIDQKASEQGYVGVKQVMNLINGKAVSNETLVDVEVVSAENLK